MIKKAVDVIRECLDHKQISQSEVSRRLGEKPQNLNEQLHRKDMKVERFAYVMEHIGYEVKVVDRGFCMVTFEYAENIIKTGEPRGLFWYRAERMFIGIDSRAGGVVTEKFDDFKKMEKWFRDRR